MTTTYTIPLEPARAEMENTKSRFIASVAPVTSSDEARAFIKMIKQEFPDASHNVPAYILGGGKNMIDYCSDDGEPGGTAGRPILTVLHGSGLGDVVLVVTRYFGGILLGTGGLVKAYTESAQEVLKKVTRAERVVVSLCAIKIAYPLFERTRLLIHKHGGDIVSEDFLTDVTIIFHLPNTHLTVFSRQMMDLSAGKAGLEELEQTEKLIRVER